MTFSKRHEQELAEIKALAYELDQRVEEGLQQLRGIRASQERLAGQSPTPGRIESPARPRQDASVATPSPPPRRRGGIGGALRKMILGPEIDLPSSEAEARAVERSREAAGHETPRTTQVKGNGADSLLAFVHIPKTAGGTVITMFAAAYSKSGVRDGGNYMRSPEKTVNAVSNPRKREGRVLAGHVPYGVYREHLPPDTRYMTFLREPVDRVLSHYYRHVLAKDSRVEKAVRRPNRFGGDRSETEEERELKFELLEEALLERRMPQLTNLCTRFLCGHDSPLGELPPSALDDAKENLRQFAFVGIQERFEESLVLLQRMLGLGAIPYYDRHVSSAGSRPKVDELPDDQRELITECNRMDAELYRFGAELFEDVVADADAGFRADVKALRARSAAAREDEWRAAALAPS